MVTRRTGRPRGRPRKPRPPPRPNGRPPLPFLCDPDRYRVAALDALMSMKEMGRLKTRGLRPCSVAVVALDIGVMGDPPRMSDTHPDHFATNWERLKTKPGSPAGTIEGRAGSLRVKYRRTVSGRDAEWRRVMAYCFLLTFTAADATDRHMVLTKIFELAGSVGEGKFAWLCLGLMVNPQLARIFRAL
jgi:hypothetical protein